MDCVHFLVVFTVFLNAKAAKYSFLFILNNNFLLGGLFFL